MKLNPDKNIVKAIRNRLKIMKETHGKPYCPCKPQEMTEDNICPCKDMRDNNHCCCGLFVSEEE